MSPLVKALVLTCESKAKPDLYALAKQLTPTDGAYQITLQKVETRDIIPWLGTIIALRFIRLYTDLNPTCACRPPPFYSQLEFCPIQCHRRSGRTSSN
jgi:hypothetical protein